MSNYAAFSSSANVTFVDNSGSTVGTSSVESVSDWYDNQTLSLTNNTIYWKSIAPKPTSNTMFFLDKERAIACTS